MAQRNPMNDRYNTDERRAGKTRKSSASAKPKAQRAATLREPAPKTKKQKKEEARERERKESQKLNAVESAFESTERYKKLRRTWWKRRHASLKLRVKRYRHHYVRRIKTAARHLGSLLLQYGNS